LLLAFVMLVELSSVMLAASGAAAQPAAAAVGPVIVGDVKGIINPVMAGYVGRVLDEAERSNAAAVVFTLDTPGGLSDATRDINLRILSTTVPVIVYVAPDGVRAVSAGVFLIRR
jgi:membrane-bound serine protease (ClpP class)